MNGRLRIAFTSCCDPLRDSRQDAWAVLAAQAPDQIVLLGDNMYMDYGIGHPLKNGAPRGQSLADFSQTMYEAYARQWQVETFARAIHGRSVHAIWDDHDFAWDNARGAGSEDGKSLVPPDKRQLSRLLFEQFRTALREQPAAYPPHPCPDGVVPADLGGIQQRHDLVPGEVRLHLLDGRSFRDVAGPESSLIGPAQRDALATAWLPEPGINVVASGTTLEDWGKYADLIWLQQQSASHRILVLSGDIHEPRFPAPGDSSPRLFEATASAMAQPQNILGIFGKHSEVFGLLDIDAANLTIGLWRKGKERLHHVIRRDSWQLVE